MPQSRQPLVSVIVAVKNETTLLKRCLDTLLDQTYPAIEIVVVNDGSGPETGAILDSYPKETCRIIHLEESLGKSGARNLGMSHAHGEFIAIADSDDAYAPNRFEKQVRYFQNNPNVSVLGSNFSVDAGYHTWNIYTSHEEIYHQMLLNNALVHSSVTFRASLLGLGFHYDTEFKAAEDYEVFARNRHSWQFATLPDALVHYRISEKTDGYIDLQREETRKIRELLLADYLDNPSPEFLRQHHLFSEITAGLNAKQLLQHIQYLVQNYQGNFKGALNRILYTQLMLYTDKYGVRVALKDKVKMVVNARQGLYKSLTTLVK